MGLQDAAVGFVEPRHDDQLSADGDSVKRGKIARLDLEGRFRSAFEGLARSVRSVAKNGSDHPDRSDRDHCHDHAIIASAITLGIVAEVRMPAKKSTARAGRARRSLIWRF
jgi:hypothetical protein